MIEGASSPYEGMTVNERLAASGKMASFDAAALARDRETMSRILSELDVSGADWTADTILANPDRYGY